MNITYDTMVLDIFEYVSLVFTQSIIVKLTQFIVVNDLFFQNAV